MPFDADCHNRNCHAHSGWHQTVRDAMTSPPVTSGSVAISPPTHPNISYRPYSPKRHSSQQTAPTPAEPVVAVRNGPAFVRPGQATQRPSPLSNHLRTQSATAAVPAPRLAIAAASTVLNDSLTVQDRPASTPPAPILPAAKSSQPPNLLPSPIPRSSTPPAKTV